MHSLPAERLPGQAHLTLQVPRFVARLLLGCSSLAFVEPLQDAPPQILGETAPALEVRGWWGKEFIRHGAFFRNRPQRKAVCINRLNVKVSKRSDSQDAQQSRQKLLDKGDGHTQQK